MNEFFNEYRDKLNTIHDDAEFTGLEFKELVNKLLDLAEFEIQMVNKKFKLIRMMDKR